MTRMTNQKSKMSSKGISHEYAVKELYIIRIFLLESRKILL